MKIRAHNCIIKEVERNEECKFLDNYHYQRYIPSLVCYGLYFENELVMLMSFGNPRYNKGYDWELLRLCTKNDIIVHGGASKLFKHFCLNNNIEYGIVSYCNRDKFQGNVYAALGFVSNGVTKGYHYEKDGISYHRSNFTKANCLKKWPQYDKTWTEAEIMKDQGFTRVDDVIGQETFIYNDKTRKYIYKVTFEDGSTYIGSHIQWVRNDDGYITSSKYSKEHKVDKKEILIDNIKDRVALDFLESFCIMDDKCSSTKNVNGNLGNFVFNHPYNISVRRSYTWSKEQRERFHKSMLGHKTSEETKRKISEANRGKHRTEEAKRNMSIAHKRKPSCMKGKHFSEEVRKHMSEGCKGRKMSRECIAKRSAAVIAKKAHWLLDEYGNIYTTRDISTIYSASVKKYIEKYGYYVKNGRRIQAVIL